MSLDEKHNCQRAFEQHTIMPSTGLPCATSNKRKLSKDHNATPGATYQDDDRRQKYSCVPHPKRRKRLLRTDSDDLPTTPSACNTDAQGFAEVFCSLSCSSSSTPDGVKGRSLNAVNASGGPPKSVDNVNCYGDVTLVLDSPTGQLISNMHNFSLNSAV